MFLNEKYISKFLSIENPFHRDYNISGQDHYVDYSPTENEYLTIVDNFGKNLEIWMLLQ